MKFKKYQVSQELDRYRNHRQFPAVALRQNLAFFRELSKSVQQPTNYYNRERKMKRVLRQNQKRNCHALLKNDLWDEIDKKVSKDISY